MVDLGKRRREREREESMMEVGGAAAERSSRPSLHNFEMPGLQWGNQKLLRCMNVDQNDEGFLNNKSSVLGVNNKGLIGRRQSEHERPRWMEKLRKSPSPAAAGIGGGSGVKSGAAGGDGIEAIREKLMFDLQEAADKMKDAILRDGLETPAVKAPAPEVEAPAPEESDDGVRPWNLRTRRAACKAPNGTNGGGIGVGGGGGGGSGNGGVAKGLKLDERRKPNSSPLRTEGKSSSPTGEKRERSRFSVSLSRREIEEDFRALTGNRPPRRPKKRPKIVQKELDTLFPGLWLTEVTADIYKVPDAPLETGKR